METPHQAALTPDQLAAVAAGGGYARCEDPQNHIVYHLIQQLEPSTIDDDYIREKLKEAAADMEQGNYAPWNLEEIKRELQNRMSSKQPSP